jgi:hypothetical protein
LLRAINIPGVRFKVIVRYFDRVRSVSLAPPERGLELLGKQRKEFAGGESPQGRTSGSE